MHLRSSLLNYVLDTNAIINLYSLELMGKKIIDEIAELSIIYLPEKVREELHKIIKMKNIDDEVYSYIISNSSRIKRVPNRQFNQCRNFVKSWIKSVYKHNPLDEGELYCLALSLFLSRTNGSFIIMITEEAEDTMEIIKNFLQTQKIGISLSPIEVILYLYSRRRIIKEEQIRRVIKDYHINLRKHIKEEEISNMIIELCRQKGIREKICHQECFGNRDALTK